MIRAVLLDLDDTLVQSDTLPFFETYLGLLGEYAAVLAPPEDFIRGMLADFNTILGEYRPMATLSERLLDRLARRFNVGAAALQDLFDVFYAHRYPLLRDRVRPRPASRRLLDHLFGRRPAYQVVVATNPGLPYAAIRQRMEWGEIGPDRYPFALITTLEEMHFGKPSADYFAEITARLDVEPGEAIMVGDDWDSDVVGAAAAGLHVYWITPDGAQPPDASLVDSHGSYEDFVALVEDGWLETLEGRPADPSALIARVGAFPAAIEALCRKHTLRVLECQPGAGEWSARDVICHLRDYAAAEDRTRLRRIVEEANPFLSGNYDPWGNAHRYADVPWRQALAELAQHREELVTWLKGLPDEAWSRPARHAIFGPTTFEEMVRFIVDHDRTHWQQMIDAIQAALPVCGPDQGA
ncbi:MAG: hypothetical protein Kow00124_04950 [Anaerolineae bacterium]